jgi:hypothetical protein
MTIQRTILLTFGLAWNAVAADRPLPSTNDVHQRALEVLRQYESTDKKPGARPPAAAPTPRQPTFADAEELYLQGKITAREFQRYLDDHHLDPAKLPNRDPQTRAVEVLRNESNKAGDGQSKSTTAAPKADASPVKAKEASAPTPETKIEAAPAPDQSSLSDVEKKMDELLRLKAAREAALTNLAVSATSTNVTGTTAPKTKRQRMDDLLKLYIDGKIPDADYKEQRAKLIAQPD